MRLTKSFGLLHYPTLHSGRKVGDGGGGGSVPTTNNSDCIVILQYFLRYFMTVRYIDIAYLASH